MTEPSLSELYAKLASLRTRIDRLRPLDENGSLGPSNGTIIPAGTILYCRPSKLRELAGRLGGEKNVEIMDTPGTEGFARGKHKEAQPWTNEVYPTDIGPSCAGIDSNTARVSTPPINNCITPTTWDPTKLFLRPESSRYSNFKATLTRFSRIVMIHKEEFSTEFKNYVPRILMEYGSLIDPGANTDFDFPKNRFASFNQYHVYTTARRTGPAEPNFFIFTMANFDELRRTVNESIVMDEVVLGNHPCFLFDPAEGSTQTSITNTVEIGSAMPFKLSSFNIDANLIDNANKTPVLRYGGYEREKRHWSGPDPRWNRTNIVQIKIIRDVRI